MQISNSYSVLAPQSHFGLHDEGDVSATFSKCNEVVLLFHIHGGEKKRFADQKKEDVILVLGSSDVWQVK